MVLEIGTCGVIPIVLMLTDKIRWWTTMITRRSNCSENFEVSNHVMEFENDVSSSQVSVHTSMTMSKDC